MEMSDAEKASREEWSDPKIFEVFEQTTRGIVREATCQVVRGVLTEYNINPHGKILELGSGIGELLGLVPPEFSRGIIGVEQSLKSLQRLKSSNPEAQVVVGNILRLPIAKSSVDTVVSFSVFDTIADLDLACRQTKGVLKSGGIFVHFLDLRPHDGVLIDGFSTDVIPFPHVVKAISGVRIDGYQLVRLADYSHLREKLNPGKRQLFDMYVRYPKDIFMFLYDQKQEILHDMAETVLSSGLVSETIPTFRQAFNSKLAASLSNKGFEILFQGDKSATTITDRKPSARNQGDFNDFHNEVGTLHKFKDPALPHDKIRVTSTLSVTVAKNYL